jgi:hypothetical protein
MPAAPVLDFDVLAPLAGRFATYAFARHPEWRPLATLAPEEWYSPGVLVVSLRSPRGDRVLEVFGETDRVTVAFGTEADRWHGHYEPWPDDAASEARVFAEALDCVAGLLAETRVTFTLYAADGRQTVFGIAEAGERLDYPGTHRIEFRSWLGTQDATVFPG